MSSIIYGFFLGFPVALGVITISSSPIVGYLLIGFGFAVFLDWQYTMGNIESVNKNRFRSNHVLELITTVILYPFIVLVLLAVGIVWGIPALFKKGES